LHFYVVITYFIHSRLCADDFIMLIY